MTEDIKKTTDSEAETEETLTGEAPEKEAPEKEAPEKEAPEKEADASMTEEGVGDEENLEAEEETEADQEEGSDGEGKKSRFFGGMRKKEKEKYEQQIGELTDRLKRSVAEFDNFRKRTEKEKSTMYVIGARDIVEKLLPIVDSFERGLSAAPQGDAFADGMQLIYKQLMTALDDMGVKPIEAVGKEFDPNLHNAVMHVEDEDAGENVVVEELQKGYTYKDFVVRHSMVKVAN